MKSFIFLVCMSICLTSRADMNPDGYIGGFTLDLGAEATPPQSWAYSKTQHFLSSNTSSAPDFQTDSNFRDSLSALGFNAEVKYPVSGSLTLSLGGSYSYQNLNSKEDYEQTIYFGSPVHLDGANTTDNSHGIYSMKASVRFYFKP